MSRTGFRRRAPAGFWPCRLGELDDRLVVMAQGSPLWKKASRLLCGLAWGALFGLAYAQAPLYTSNQNQYFLHGLAQAGRGYLRQDWLANPADPTPLFPGLVRLTAGLLDERLFYLYFLLLAAVYLHSLWGIADRLKRRSSSRGRSLLFLATFFVLHSAGLRIALGGSAVWLLYRGGRNLRLPLRAGGLALALVLPALVYNARTFLPASPAALQVLAQVRLPEHAVVAGGVDPAAAGRLALGLVGLYPV